MTAMLALSGVCSFYGAVQALRDVDLEVDPGEIVTLIGANGAGKSTLMMTVCGNPRPRAGSIRHEGEDITHLPTHVIMRRGIAQSPEGRRIFGRMTVYENLLMGAEAAGRTDTRALLDEVFALFPRLSERIGQRGGTLSGGEQQMLAIARGLMSDPQVLMIDELSLGLAPVVVQQLFGTLQKLKEQGITILLVEQNVHLALSASDYAYVIAEGRLFTEGPSAKVAAMPDIRRAYLGV
jgi:branched-chain amino acid transport system ATP-binding protein